MIDWGIHNQPGLSNEIEQLGSQLSIEIGCAIRYPAYNKNLFECKCGVIFPVYLLKSNNWELVKRKHIEEGRYALA